MIISLIFFFFFSQFHSAGGFVVNFTVFEGVFFNYSTPYLKDKVFSWLEASHSFTYGLAPPLMKGNKITLTGTHEAHYQFIIDTEQSWRNIITDPNCCKLPLEKKKRALFAAIELNKSDVERLSISDRVHVLFLIMKATSLPQVQQVGLIMTREIRLYPLYGSKKLPQPNSLSFIWLVNCSVNRKQFSAIMTTLKTAVKIVKQRIKVLNRFLVALPVCNPPFHLRHKRSPRAKKTLIISKTLPPIKISAPQIMNWQVPSNLFASLPFSYDIQVFEIINGSRKSLDKSPNSWIKFFSSTNTIRFNPNSNDIGSRLLHICTKGAPNNESCMAMEVSVMPLPAQTKLMYIRGDKDFFILNYTLPLAWFRSYDVIKDTDIQIASANASIPIVSEVNNRLLILNLGSLEDTVLEIKVNVIIKNLSLIPLNLFHPIMELPKPKRSGYIFSSTILWKSNLKNQSQYILYHLMAILKKFSLIISETLTKEGMPSNIKVFILRIYKEKFTSNEYPKNNLRFDWTFIWNTVRKEMCIFPFDNIQKKLLNISLLCCNIVNSSILSVQQGAGCGSTPKYTTNNNIKQVSISTPKALFLSTKVISAKSDSKNISILPKMDLTVKCGEIFQWAIPTFFLGSTSLKIIPVDKMAEIEWIDSSPDKKYLLGVLPIKSCLKKDVQIRLVGIAPFRDLPSEVHISISIILPADSQKYKFQIELTLTPPTTITTLYLWNVIFFIKNYIKKNCIKNQYCTFNLTLLSYKIENNKYLNMSLGYAEKLGECSESLAVFLELLLIDKSHPSSNMPNSKLMSLFQQQDLGQITTCELIMKGKCKNKTFFPPDLGQKVAFNNILKIISLQSFHRYYNRTVSFTLVQSKMKYSNWIKVSPDSLSLFILASTEHVSFQPYIIKLAITPSVSTDSILPKIALEVKNLVHHPLFHPFIRELNHQMSVDVITPQAVVDTSLPTNITIELCQLIDQTLRPRCNVTVDNDCGTDILAFLYSVTDVNSQSHLNYKMSSLRVLKSADVIQSKESKYKKLNCPMDAIYQMESILNRRTRTTNYSWSLESIKVSTLGPCAYDKTSYLRTKVTEELGQKTFQETKDVKIYLENSQQIFLMATVIPACSFVIITLFLGLTTACFLQYRRRKKLQSYTMKTRSHCNTPVIFLSDLETYNPPSKPLILRHEMPPEPLPADEDILIANVHAFKYRSTI